MNQTFLSLFILAALTACASSTSMPDAVNGSPSGTAATSQDASVTGPPADSTLVPGTPPYAPRPGDELLTHSEAKIVSSALRVMESYPPQFSLTLKGTLPTACYELRVMANPPDAENRVKLEVYGVADPNVICAQVIQPFQQNIPLGSFPTGKYSLWVNGVKVAEFAA